MAFVPAATLSGFVLFLLSGALAILPTNGARDPEPVPFDFSVFPACVNKTGWPAEKPVPKLAPSFTIKVEGKTFTDSFFDSEGYYESAGQRGATYVLSQGVQHAYLYDFVTGNAFSQTGKDSRTCTKEDLWATGCNSYAYFIAELAGYSNISTRCNITAGPVTYLGTLNDTTVRAIKVQQWHQCVHDGNANITYMNIYSFTADGVISPSTQPGFKDPVPIRFHSQNANTTNATSDKEVVRMSVYDFTYYVPEIEDPEKFLPEPGVFCPGWARENETMPDLPEEFSLTMMTVARKAKDVHSMKLNFDFNSNLTSFITDHLNGTHFPPNHVKNRTLYRIVHDYTSGLSFSMPVGSWLTGAKGCNVTAIDVSGLDAGSDNSSYVHLKHARELFGLNRSDWIYVGERQFNNMPTYVWVTQRNTTKDTITTESYWLHENWTTSNQPVLAAIIVYNSYLNGTQKEVFQSTISDYNSFPFHWRTFDVEECLKNDKQQLITFCLKVQNYTEITQRMGAFETSLRDTLRDLSQASPLQFTDIQVTRDESDKTKAHIWVTVLDWPANKTGSVVTPTRYQSAADVVDDLSKDFGKKDVTRTIKFAGKTQSITFVGNTLQSGSDLVRPSTPAPSPASTTSGTHAPPLPVVEEGYTSGSMAGLAIAMIIIGGVAGLVAGFLLWKRNTGIAYQVYD